MTAKEESSEDSEEEQLPLLGAMTLEDAKPPRAKPILKPFLDFTQHAWQKLQGSGAGTTSSQKVEEKKQVSGTNAKDNESLNPLWEPHIMEKHLFQVPDIASDTDFPVLMPSKAAVKKKK